MTIRQQIATLPEPYRTMAEKYEKDEDVHATNFDAKGSLTMAFMFDNTDEGSDFWWAVTMYISNPSNPLPPLP